MLYDSPADEPNIVVFHPEPDVCYCYYGTELVRLGTFSSVRAYLDLQYVWYLSDNDDGRLKVLANTMVTLSPRKRSNEPVFVKFYALLKEVTPSGNLCMPSWAFEEIFPHLGN